MDTLDYILKKFEITSLDQRMPIVLRNVTRWRELPPLFSELGFDVGAEIGVEQGHYSETLLKANPNLKLYSIDPWMTYSRYADHVSQNKLDRYYEEAKARLVPYNCEIIRATSMEAVLSFNDNSLDFVYIDGNHDFEFVVNDIIHWSRIVRPGGIVSGHDYRRDKADRIPFHVIQATQAYTDAYKIKPWFITKGDRSPSWLWVKR